MLETRSGNLRPLKAGDRLYVQDLGEGMVKVSAVCEEGRPLHISKEHDALLFHVSPNGTSTTLGTVEMMAAAANLNVVCVETKVGAQLFELKEPSEERGSGVFLIPIYLTSLLQKEV